MQGNPFFWHAIAALANATPNTTLSTCFHELERHLTPESSIHPRNKLARASVAKLINQLNTEVEKSISSNGPIDWDTSIGEMVISELLPN